jgi:hypothetical protein
MFFVSKVRQCVIFVDNTFWKEKGSGVLWKKVGFLVLHSSWGKVSPLNIHNNSHSTLGSNRTLAVSLCHNKAKVFHNYLRECILTRNYQVVTHLSSTNTSMRTRQPHK